MKNYFPVNETKCLCGCGENNVSEVFRIKLNKTRITAGVPFVPTSFCRCESHNKAEGGSENSAHISNTKKSIKCKAVDIKATSSRQRYRIIQAAIIVGFNRIGIARDFIHLDDDTSKSEEVVWLY